MAELVLPAGSKESLIAACENGADAVYLGLKEYSARSSAENFTMEDLGKACTYARENNVRVLLAMNTLVKNSEVDDFFKTLEDAYVHGIDGVIVQHLSFVPIIKKSIPELKVNVSTQAGIHNPEGAKFVKELGADRVVLPREIAAEEVPEMVAAGPDTEMFVHGALCLGFSGQCLFSSIIGRRSGNRGKCAQPCRALYGDRYSLSTRDLCLVGKVRDIVEMGVKALKIEGRMRSPNYVATTARIYRKVLDGGFYTDADYEALKLAFNREFTDGYFGGHRNVVSDRMPSNRGAFLGRVQADDKVTLKMDLAVGDGVGIMTQKGMKKGGIIDYIELDGVRVDRASEGQTVKINTFNANNDRMYKTSSRDKWTSDTDIDGYEPRLRRKIPIELPEMTKRKAKAKSVFYVHANSLEEVEYLPKNAVPIVDLFNSDLEKMQDSREDLGVYTQPINFNIEEDMGRIDRYKPDTVVVGNWGMLAALKGYDKYIIADYSLNTFNDLDMAFLHDHLGDRVLPVMSLEMNFNELTEVKDKRFAVFSYGDIPVLKTRYSLNRSSVIDKTQAEFKIKRTPFGSAIMNSKRLDLRGHVPKLEDNGIKHFVFASTRGFIDYKNAKDKKKFISKRTTRGHLKRGVY